MKTKKNEKRLIPHLHCCHGRNGAMNDTVFFLIKSLDFKLGIHKDT